MKSCNKSTLQPKIQEVHYHWVYSFIIHKYNIGSHKKGWFVPTPRNHSLLFTPIAYIKTTKLKFSLGQWF
jgi:hypothetical protein